MQEKDAGNAFYSAKKYQEAIASFTSGIQKTTSDQALLAILYSNRSQAWLELGDFAAALTDADKCISLDAKFAKAHFRRGKALHHMGRHVPAVQSIENAVLLEPEYSTGAVREFLNKAYVSVERQRCDSWQTSDELKRQMQLQRDMAAPYVFEVIGRDGGSAVKMAADFKHGSAADAFADAFGEASNGDLEALKRVFLILRDHSVCTANGQHYKLPAKIIGEQLQKEFNWDFTCPLTIERGPDFVPRPVKKPAVGTERPSLYCIDTCKKAGRSCLYPSGPWWVDHVAEFVTSVNKEQPGSMSLKGVQMAADAFKQQRIGDAAMHRLDVVYKGIGSAVMTASEHKKLYAKAGFCFTECPPDGTKFTHPDIVHQRVHVEYTVNYNFVPDVALPVKCDQCGIVLEMVSPPQCECGEYYCSEECHAKDWSAHKGSCLQVVKAQTRGGAVQVNGTYWHYVMLGLFHYEGGLPDFSQKWRSLKPKAAIDEFGYLVLNERIACMNRVTEVQKKMDQVKIVCELILQHTSYSHPLVADSVARLQFKVFMLGILTNMMSHVCPGAVEPAEKTMKKFDSRLKNAPKAIIPADAHMRPADGKQALKPPFCAPSNTSVPVIPAALIGGNHDPREQKASDNPYPYTEESRDPFAPFPIPHDVTDIFYEGFPLYVED